MRVFFQKKEREREGRKGDEKRIEQDKKKNPLLSKIKRPIGR